MHAIRWTLGLCLLTSVAIQPRAHAAPSASPKAPALTSIIKKPAFNRMRISPNGKYFAVLVPNIHDGERNALVIYDIAQHKLLKAWSMGVGRLFTHYWWVDSTHIIAEPALRQGGLNQPTPTGELFAIDAAHGSSKTLFGYRVKQIGGTHIKSPRGRRASAHVVSVLGDDPRHILIATRAWNRASPDVTAHLERLDIRNGLTHQIDTAPAADTAFMADHADHVSLAYGKTPKLGMRIWYKPKGQTHWTLIDHSGFMTPLGFARDNRHIYVNVAQPHGPDAVELLNPQTGTLQMVFQPKFADIERLLPDMDHKGYFGAITASGKRGVTVFPGHEHSRAAQATLALQHSFPGQLAYLSSDTSDGRQAVVTVASDRNPGAFYLMNMKHMHASYLASRMRWIDPKAMRPMQPITLTARDGVKLHGYLATPRGHKPFPLVVLPHGGPFGIRDMWGFDPQVQLLASRGYAVLQVNYRGSGGYGHHFLTLGFGQWGGKLQDDLTDATRWAIHNGTTSAGRICIFGGSYGGYAALEGAEQQPDLYRCAIGYDGVYDLRLLFSKGDIRHSTFGKNYLNAVLGHHPKQLLARSPIAHAGRIKADVMLIHGGEDQRAPIAHAREMKQALETAHVPVVWMERHNEGHGFYLLKDRRAMYRRLLHFLDREIGPAAHASASTNIAQQVPVH